MSATLIRRVAAAARAKANVLRTGPEWRKRFAHPNQQAFALDHFASDLEAGLWQDWLTPGPMSERLCECFGSRDCPHGQPLSALQRQGQGDEAPAQPTPEDARVQALRGYVQHKAGCNAERCMTCGCGATLGHFAWIGGEERLQHEVKLGACTCGLDALLSGDPR